MALTTKVTKQGVTKVMDGMWLIAISIDVLQDGKAVMTRELSIKYKTGQDIGVVTSSIKEAMQKAVDDYIMEQRLFADAKLDAAIATLNSEVVVREE
jgi:hypothetical protein